MQRPAPPARGEIWFTDFDPVGQARGHEQAGPRPALVVSVTRFNRLPTDLAFVVPITSVVRAGQLLLTIHPPEGGVRRPSTIRCDHLRSISIERLRERWGIVEEETLDAVMRRIC